MRILNLLKYFPPYPGGIESIACDLVEELAARGVVETVLSHGTEGYPGSADIRQVLSTSYGELLYAPLAPSFPLKLFRELRSNKHDLLHIHVPNLSAFWPLLMGIKIPYVVHWHADVIFPEEKKMCRRAYRFYSLLERVLLAKAAAIVPTSEAYLEHSRPLKPFRDKCSVIPLGLNFSRMAEVPDEKRLDIKRRWTGGRDSFLVTSVGRFAHYKGFSHLIDAAAALEDVTVIIGGEGEERKELLQKIKDMGLEGRVILPGRLDNDELHSLMACSDAFCLPSIERTEAFGVVLLEAMFYQKPLITTKIVGSATSWVNVEGETGLTVPVKDSAALADAVNILKNDSELRNRMGRAGRERLEQNFSITRTADSFYQLYSSLL